MHDKTRRGIKLPRRVLNCIQFVEYNYLYAFDDCYKFAQHMNFKIRRYIRVFFFVVRIKPHGGDSRIFASENV